MKRSVALLVLALASAPLAVTSATAQTSVAQSRAAQSNTKPSATRERLPASTPREASSLLSSNAAFEDDIPVGTAIRMKLETALSTRSNQAGDTFSGRVTEPVVVNGKTVIPVGASLSGHVTRVNEPRRITGRPMIDLRPESVVLPNGETLSINAVVVDTDHRPQTSVDDEGRIKGKGYTGRDTKEIAIGTGAGATVGAVTAGSKGALVGAAIGATATVTHWLVKRHSTELPAGTEIVIELSRPIRFTSGAATAGQ
ncbi:MAG TPA: glycine zipper family protein [Clostridia bacterium]|nr:glycine zipper family protein [Clostridia bacterium]